MQLIMMLLSLFGIFALVCAVPTTDDLDLPYPLVKLQYNGTLGGHDVQLSGNVQEMMAQMQALHPDFELPSAGNPTHTRDFEARNKDGIICGNAAGFPGQNWKQAYESQIYKTIDFLTALGSGNCGVSSHSCTELGCDGGSGVFLCNDSGSLYRPACIYLATYARDICDKCAQPPPIWPQNDWWVSGQEFDSDQYNVIVRWGCDV